MPAHGGHIVVGHYFRNGLQFLESVLVQSNNMFKGLIRKMSKIHPPAVTKHDGTGMHNLQPAAHNGFMGAPVHLALVTGRMVDRRPGRLFMPGPDRADVVF